MSNRIRKTEWIKWCRGHKDYFRSNSKYVKFCPLCKDKRMKYGQLKRLKNVKIKERQQRKIKKRKV